MSWWMTGFEVFVWRRLTSCWILSAMSPEIQEWSHKSRSRINNLYLLTRAIDQIFAVDRRRLSSTQSLGVSHWIRDCTIWPLETSDIALYITVQITLRYLERLGVTDGRTNGRTNTVIAIAVRRQKWFILAHPVPPCILEIGEKLPPKVIIWPCVVSLWPWPLTCWLLTCWL